MSNLKCESCDQNERRLRLLAELVQQMRLRQKEFFNPRTRTATTVGEAKVLERAVDKELAAILDVPPLTLFDLGGESG
jgi:hypothetical protein